MSDPLLSEGVPRPNGHDVRGRRPSSSEVSLGYDVVVGPGLDQRAENGIAIDSRISSAR